MTSSKISSLIQEAEAKAKSKSSDSLNVVNNANRKRNNSSTENLNPNNVSKTGSSSSIGSTGKPKSTEVRRQSPLGRESDQSKKGTNSNAPAPKLPPKPGKIR